MVQVCPQLTIYDATADLVFGMSAIPGIFHFLLDILCFKILYLIAHFRIWKWMMESTSTNSQNSHELT